MLRNSVLLAGAHKIDPANLQWVAAYHNEDSHPHVHLLVYSSDPAEGYLTNTGIERMRGGFAKIIFQDTLKQLYDKQTDARDLLREQAGRLLKDLTYRIEAGDCADEQLETMLTQLRDRLQDVPGKRIYQYLPPDVKRLVNTAVDRLVENDQIADLYKIWQEQRRAILDTYSDTERESQPLSRRKEFRPVQNMVIRAGAFLVLSLTDGRARIWLGRGSRMARWAGQRRYAGVRLCGGAGHKVCQGGEAGQSFCGVCFGQSLPSRSGCRQGRGSGVLVVSCMNWAVCIETAEGQIATRQSRNDGILPPIPALWLWNRNVATETWLTGWRG